MSRDDRLDVRAQCERYEHACALALLASAAAHQVNSPLNAARLNAELARTRADNGEARETIDKVIRELDRCAEANRALSVYAGKPPHQPLACSPAVLAREACALAGPELARSRATLALDAHDLPPRALDAVAVRTAIFILLRDACARARRGVSLHVRVHREAGHALFCVEDDGPPMPEAPFARGCNPLRAPDRATAGYVLGAGIARFVAVRHDGEMQMTSLAGYGTRYELRIPVGSATSRD